MKTLRRRTSGIPHTKPSSQLPNAQPVEFRIVRPETTNWSLDAAIQADSRLGASSLATWRNASGRGEATEACPAGASDGACTARQVLVQQQLSELARRSHKDAGAADWPVLEWATTSADAAARMSCPYDVAGAGTMYSTASVGLSSSAGVGC